MSSPKINLETPIRRIITGHDSKGTAIFASDDILYPVDPNTAPAFSAPNESSAFGVIQIHRSRGFPVDNTLPFKEPHKTLVPLADTKGASVSRHSLIKSSHFQKKKNYYLRAWISSKSLHGLKILIALLSAE
jgi:hypothetical protein